MVGGAAIMGIVNVTADSFYDGGKYVTVDAAVKRALELIGDGADIIDIGGSSSRPGAELLPPEEEIARVVPVIKALVGAVAPDRPPFAGMATDKPPFVGAVVPDRPPFISVDTVWSSVAEAAVNVGAAWINDISAGRIDPRMAGVVAETGSVVVLTHSRGTPENMQNDPRYENVVADVCRELSASVKVFKDAGVDDSRIILDPGFGFGKTADHNVALLRGIDEIARLGYPVLVGVSRKSFIGAITGRPVEERLAGTLAATAVAYQKGTRIFRVHDVRETVDFLKVFVMGDDRPKLSF